MLRWMLRGTVCFTLAAGVACAQAPSRLLDVSKALQDASRGKEVMAQLAQFPFGECQTVEYHVAMAKAARNANVPARAAEAFGIVNLLPAQVTPSAIGMVGTELPVLRSWLTAKSEELYKKAVAAKAAGDMKTAVKSYLVAVKCDASVMSRDDSGLGSLGLNALKKLAAAHPEKVDLQFQLAYYDYLFGDSRGAIAALESHQKSQTDVYKKWRAGIWLATIKAGEAGPAPRQGGAIAATGL